MGRNVVTYNGDITVSGRSHLKGDIVIKDSKGGDSGSNILKIYIKDESVVDGDIVVLDSDRDVKVYLSGGGNVKGNVEGAEVVDEAE